MDCYKAAGEINAFGSAPWLGSERHQPDEAVGSKFRYCQGADGCSVAVVAETALREMTPLAEISRSVPLMLLCQGQALNKMPSVDSRTLNPP